MPTPTSADGLSIRQAKFLAALLTHASIEEAAAVAGISHVTAYTYLKLNSFEREYARARKAVVRNALVQIQRLTTKAARTLEKLMDAKHPQVRAFAARTVLDMALRAVTYDDHEQRLRALEEDEHASAPRLAG